jgi:hypothetical protein
VHRLHKQALPAAMSTHQNQSQEESKIANWMTIRNMCRRYFAAQTVEELEMQAMKLAQQHAE